MAALVRLSGTRSERRRGILPLTRTKPGFVRARLFRWQLQILKESRAFRYSDKVYAGDLRNTAVFFPEQYHDPRELPSVESLKLLAAHTILMGHEREPAYVEGLEIMVFRYGEQGPSLLSQEEIERLEQFSQKLDDKIRKLSRSTVR